jgi:hypothetical protein
LTKTSARWLILGIGAFLGLWLMNGGTGAMAALAGAGPTPPAPGDRRAYHSETGRLSFLGFDPGHGPQVSAALRGRSLQAQGKSLLAPYVAAFGIRDADRQLRLESAKDHSVRFQQVVEGVPVLAGELVVNISHEGNLESINGEISPDPALDTSPQVDAQAARQTALQAVAKAQGVEASELEADSPQLWVYDEKLLLPSDRPVELVWRTEVRSRADAPIRELVLINAVSGGVSLHFNQVDTSWGAMGEGGLDVPLLQDTETPTGTDSETAVDTVTATPTDTATSVPGSSETPGDTATTAAPTPTLTPSPTIAPTALATTTAPDPGLLFDLLRREQGLIYATNRTSDTLMSSTSTLEWITSLAIGAIQAARLERRWVGTSRRRRKRIGAVRLDCVPRSGHMDLGGDGRAAALHRRSHPHDVVWRPGRRIRWVRPPSTTFTPSMLHPRRTRKIESTDPDVPSYLDDQ